MKRITDKNIQKFETEHIDAVRRIASESCILLRKDGRFPLKNACSIAAFGNGVRKTIKGGTGSGDVNVRHFVNVEEGLKNAGFKITTGKWLDSYDEEYKKAKKSFLEGIKEEAKKYNVNPMMLLMGRSMKEFEHSLPLESSEATDTAIYVLSRNSGEGADRTVSKGDINLTDSEVRDIKALNEKYTNFMLVLNCGGLVDLTPVKDVKNILCLGQLGTPTGDVLADILLGKSYPSGKLTMTWTAIEDYPSTKGFGDFNDTEYSEGIYVGYRYFDTFGKDVLYPFGYGLGYTDFETSVRDVNVTGTKVVAEVEVQNIGSFKGKEVVQLYYSSPEGKLEKPYQELAVYEKTRELEKGEKDTLTLSFDIKDMAGFDEETASYILEKGEYLIRIGTSSRNTHIAVVLKLNDTVTVSKLRNICQGDKVKNPLKHNDEIKCIGYPEEESEKRSARIIEINTECIETVKVNYSAIRETEQKSARIDWNDVISGKKTVQDFAEGLTDEELALLCIGNYDVEAKGMSVIGQASDSVAGAAGQTTGLIDKKLNLKTLVMADGPAGIRISPVYKMVKGKAKPCSSAFGEDFFALMDEETLKAMAAAVPDKEEQEAPENYQYCVAIPIGTNLAQMFNKEAVKTLGDIVGYEMETFGVHLWLAPALNIYRSPLCGRNFEYYSEDPVVAGLTAASVTKGVQLHKGTGTTIKHFACNNQETNRYGSNSILSERALREIYLKGFEICVKLSQPKSLMTSYNLINGEHSCNSKGIVTYALRDEWGYKGLVMTDWLVTGTFMNNPKAKHGCASAAGCVKAGNDLVMPGLATDKDDILKALKDKDHPYSITRGELITTAERVLDSILELNEAR